MNGEHEKILVSIEELKGDFRALSTKLEMFMETAQRTLENHESRIRVVERGQWKASGLAAVLTGALVFLANLVKSFWGR